jgi:hypothetical protein
MRASDLALIVMDYINQRKTYHNEMLAKRPDEEGQDYHLSGIVELLGIEQRILSLIHQASEHKEK